jgi:3',5'-cyclic AMP phosphodiesterase CpdA
MREPQAVHFAHVSDLHLFGGPDAEPSAREKAHAIAAAIARDLARISEILDFIVVSGDLTEDGHAKSFAQFWDLFAPIDRPIYTIPGNHDGPSAYYMEASAGRLSRSDISARIVDLGAARLLGIDTCVEGETSGALNEGDLEVVAKALDSAGASQLIIVMHHPPFAPGLREFDEIARLEGADGLARLLVRSGAAPIVLCGHVHRAYQARWHGASCFVAGSPALPFTSARPFGNTPIHPADEPPFYFVHSIDAVRGHIVTPQFVADTGRAP